MSNARTRIDTESLGKPGSIELPEGVKLCCSNCGEPCADHGRASLQFGVSGTNLFRVTVSCPCGHGHTWAKVLWE